MDKLLKPLKGTNLWRMKIIPVCQNFRHFGAVLVLVTLTALRAQADEGMRVPMRAPASYIPTEEIIEVPEAPRSWASQIFVEDDRGVMRNMKRQMRIWEEREEYARVWSLESTGQYRTVSQEEKSAFLRRNMLRYADKRLSGEMKKAPKNSTLGKAKAIHQAIKPKASLNVSKDIKIRFKARVLQGRGTLKVQNPLMDYSSEISASGRVRMRAEKNIKSLGLNTHINYEVNDKRYVSTIDKHLVGNFSARVESDQSADKMMFSSGTDRRLQLLFGSSF